jgi:hypothetical protein
MSWFRAHSGTCDQILLPVFFLWGALSDDRTGLQLKTGYINEAQHNSSAGVKRNITKWHTHEALHL